MKRILALWMAASLFVAQPCYAVVLVGFGQSPPAADLCDGTDTFCTSWETGTNALNTGATGNEDVFNLSGGSFSRTTGGTDGTYRITGEYGSYVGTSNGGTGFGESVTVTGYFRFDDENSGESEIVQLYEPAAWYELVKIQRATDVVTDNNLVPINVKMKLTSSTLTEVSMGVVSLNEDEWYHYSLVYNLTTNTARVIIYNSSDSSVLDTGAQSLTIDTTVGIPQVRLYASAYGYISHDAFKVNP